MMLDFIAQILSSDDLAPHGICLLWRPELIWTHVVSDALIGLAYFSIPLALASFVSRRHDIAFSWVFWSFAVFILACGTTHFVSIWTLWNPDYGLEAIIKAVTAAASVATAVLLWPLLPKALALPSPAQLRTANDALTAGIRERDAALEALASETSERLRMEDMLRQSQKMEAVGQLTGGVAHDFNNLLTIVVANLERIDRRTPDAGEDVKAAIRGAMEGAERAAALTRQLLAFARKQPLRPQATDLNALIDELSVLLRRTLGERVTLRTELDRSLGEVTVDPNQLENALLNLAVNARDAIPETGTVVIRTRALKAGEATAIDGAAAAVEVEDTGTGMPPEVAERAFEPFFTTKPLGHGTGLGLSQVYGFVKQSRGHVDISTGVGEGTRVRILLPATAEERSALAPAVA